MAVCYFMDFPFTGRSKTPTPNKASKTPNKADRFIPSRSNSNYDLCHYMVKLIVAHFSHTIIFNILAALGADLCISMHLCLFSKC